MPDTARLGASTLVPLAIALLLVALGTAGLRVAPELYARYVHPIGRIAGDVRVGGSCSKTRSRMASLPVVASDAESAKASGIRYSEFDGDTHPVMTHVAASYKGLRLRDVDRDPPIELIVLCAPPDEVVRVHFHYDSKPAP